MGWGSCRDEVGGRVAVETTAEGSACFGHSAGKDTAMGAQPVPQLGLMSGLTVAPAGFREWRQQPSLLCASRGAMQAS